MFKPGEILEVVVKPEQLRGFHNDPEMKQSYIMAAVGREAAEFDMSHEDAKQLCRAMIENLFARSFVEPASSSRSGLREILCLTRLKGRALVNLSNESLKQFNLCIKEIQSDKGP
jgi:hypothetical protein